MQCDYLDLNIIMRIIAMSNVKDWIKRCEACKLKIYKDTVDKWTVGWGRNIQDNGISQDEADYMFENDFKRVVRELEQNPWYIAQPQGVKDALINMNFNMGINRLMGFKNMIRALIERNYTLAAQEALNSKWAGQVGQRAKDVAVMIREGK